MFEDLISLFSGWYADYVEMIRDLISYDVTQIFTMTVDGQEYVDTYTDTINPAIWSAYVPWEQLIAAATLIVFTVLIFKFLRSVLCKIL